MPGFEDLLKFVLKATNVAPAYAPERCIAVTQSSTACHACVAACPHEAIELGRQIDIDEVDCSGCGLCVQLCPSQALEPKVSYEPGSSVRCSEVGGSAQSVLCLGRLQASDIVRLTARRGEVTLAHGDCSDCPIGVPAILEGLAEAVEEARGLLRAHGRDIEVRIEQRERLDEDGTPQGVSRRDLLSGGIRSIRRSAAGALAPLEAVLRVPSEDQGPRALPQETLRRYHILELARPEPGEQVHWRLPRVDDGCIMCPVCTRVCPTGAFSRDFEPAEGSGPVLRLEPERCLDCGACVEACPVKVIHMDDEVTWGELSGGTIEAFRSPAGHGPQGILFH
ncbi:MAG TPA: 4Fe-4S binding protein [Trueperaceae bacterium]|nr:4Fe-4S binding protein [Trueperaceae bacterium]